MAGKLRAQVVLAPTRTSVWRLAWITVFATTATLALAQSTLLEAERSVIRLADVDDPFAIGEVLHNPRTLKATSLEELVDWTMGSARQEMYAKYHGDFDLYWQARREGAAGKAFEAIEVFEENQRLASLGDHRRYVLTAAEGHPGHKADVLEIDRWGRVRGRLQLKAGYGQTLKALEQTDYAGMRIVTTKDTLAGIKKSLSYEIQKAARRNLPLSAEWVRVRDALRDGRLLTTWPSGAAPSARSATYRVAEQVVRKQWQRLARVSRPVTALVAKPLAAASKTRVGKILGSGAGKGLVVVDVAANTYLIYSDFTRWHNSEIGGGYFGFKAGLRSAQIALTAYAFWAPDPSLVTKVIAGGGALLLTVADAVSDPVYAAAQERTSQLLRELEREERYHYCRRQILADMQRAIEVSE